jgi:RimJ/RimL family protein N-acetyltransferase
VAASQRGTEAPDDRGDRELPARLAYPPFTLDQAELLVAWLTAEVWPFHGRPRPEPDDLRARIADGDFAGLTSETHWVLRDGSERVGLVHLEYLDEPSPTTDFRVRAADRGQGIGTEMVRWAAGHVFASRPETPRLEGQTRADNAAMRRVFRRCGWVREAYYRRSWPAGDGSGAFLDSVGYAILRDDWARGTVTPVPQDD